MDLKKLQEEINKVQNAPFAKKTDRQLMAYEFLSRMHKEKNKGLQPSELVKSNNPMNRLCKLTPECVKQIREKYVPYLYGKQRLAKEYGVSTSVIYRIIQGKSWKAQI